MRLHTIKRIAAHLGVTERTVCRWRAAGLLKLNSGLGGVWVESDDLDRQVVAIQEINVAALPSRAGKRGRVGLEEYAAALEGGL